MGDPDDPPRHSLHHPRPPRWPAFSPYGNRRLIRLSNGLYAVILLLLTYLADFMEELLGDPVRQFIIQAYSPEGFLAGCACIGLSLLLLLIGRFSRDRWIRRSSLIAFGLSLPVGLSIYLLRPDFGPISPKRAVLLVVIGFLPAVPFLLCRCRSILVARFWPLTIFVTIACALTMLVQFQGCTAELEPAALFSTATVTATPTLLSLTAEPTPTSLPPTIEPSLTPLRPYPTQPGPQPSPTSATTSTTETETICPPLLIYPTPANAGHQVMAGQSLSVIAEWHGTTTEALVEANKAYYPTLIEYPDCVRAGWSLVIPPS